MGFVSDILGGITGADQQAEAAQNAANTQAGATKYAADLSNQAFQQLQTNLKPYMDLGSSSIPGLQALLGGGALTRQFSFDPSKLDQTPGYQFTLQQGLKGVNNVASAKGLGMSGAQLKGISDYTAGLASQTYQQQYQNALQNFMTNYGVNSDQYNRLAGLLGLGQNAAAGVGNAGMQTASNVGNLATQGANAQAAAQIAAGNSGTNAINSALNIGLGGAGIFSLLSDARHKKDIRLIGRTEGGNKVYEFRYKSGDGSVHVGVMAQEVERTNPDAVTEIAGVKYVDYAKVA